MRFGTKALGLTAGVALLATLAACSTTSVAAPADDAAAAPVEDGTFAKDPGTLVYAVLPDHEGADQDAEPFADYIAAA